MERFTAYHGTSYPIEYFNLEHLGEHQGQTIFSGIYFTTSLTEAKEYAILSSERTGNKPRLYVAELELEKPLYANRGSKFFSTKADFMKFVKEFFPDYLDENGELLYYKRGYLEEKYSTYFGQYSLIKFAAKENHMSIAEIQDWLGYDSCIDGTNIVVSNLNCIQSFEEIPFNSTQSSVESLSATEKIADRYLLNSRHGADYKTMPGNRYKRRMRIRDKGAARVWYDIDVNKFFNKDEFLCHIPVIGETNEYIEEVEIKNWLPVLRKDIKDNGFSVIAFRKSLTKAMRTLNIKINCTCLHPDTRIPLLDDTTPTIKELTERFNAGEELWAYSVDENTFEFIPNRIIKAGPTKSNREFLKITLDNDKEILTTPDHLYMLRNGEYSEARDLKVGQSLMPLYTRVNKFGYLDYKLNSGKLNWKSVYRRVAEITKPTEISEAEERAKLQECIKPFGVAIHHKNFNKLNNSPQNLQVMTSQEHWKYHSDEVGFKRLWKDTDWATSQKIKCSIKMKETNDAYKEIWHDRRVSDASRMLKSGKGMNSPEVIQRMHDKRAQLLRERASNYTEEQKRRISEGVKAAAKRGAYKTHIEEKRARMKLLSSTPEAIRNTRLGKIRYCFELLINSKLEVIPENFELIRKTYRKYSPSWKSEFKTFSEALCYFGINHSIKSIEKIILPSTDVYDLTMQDAPNFLTDAGVILHNCPDFLYSGFAYYRTQDNENSGRPENRPPVVRNPDNNKGDGCKHILHILSNRTWIARVARILFNYCLNLYKQNKPLFERTIGKKLEITDEMVEGRPIEKKRKKEVLPQEPPQEQPQEEIIEQETEVVETPPEETSNEMFAGEAYYGNYYRNNNSFDEDQQFMLEAATSAGVSVLDYATPQNSPEQIGELTSDIQSNLPSKIIEILKNPDLSVREHQVIREAYLKGVDLTPYIGDDPEVLRQLFLGAKQGIPIKTLRAPGRNHRQLEQLRAAYKLDKNLFRKLLKQDLNYEQLKAEIKRWKDEKQSS